MAKILGLDLGTNSIGWAIRDTEADENQIIEDGVLIFQKGVGDGKSGEFSLAAERRKNRSKRRLYNAKRYRKWELLKILIENGMCPLTLEELRLWSIGNWQKIEDKWKNLGRIYPVNNAEFQQWLAFDLSIFGHKGISNNEKLVRKNPYDLRCELIESEEQNEYDKKLRIGRALYHLVQRRGFKSSRKSGQSAYAKNEDIEKLKTENPDFQIAILAKEKLDKGERFRASGVIQRKYFEDEFEKICEVQKLSKELTQKLYKAIYFVRPLRSQKGLVGNCTLERNKPRIPISHPKFEEFRALQFINNIKWREKDQKEFAAISMPLKKKIFEELFFRKLTSGKNKGKVNDDSYFKFDEIIKKYSEDGKYEFNYRNLPNVSTCPTIAALMNVFDNDWTDKFIRDENTYGINWEGLSINYIVKYGNKAGQSRTLKIDEIWHLLFDYIQTKDKQEDLEKFCKEVLGFDDEKTKSFSEIDIPQGYGSLSYKAISKILPFLQSGFIYSEAVLFANLKKVFGENFEKNKEQAKSIIAKTIVEVAKTKENLNIVNGLIKNFFGENEYPKPVGLDEEIVYDAYKKECENYLNTNWQSKTNEEKEYIWEFYAKFLNGDQTIEEKASGKPIDFYKLPRLDEAIKQGLKDSFKVSDNALKHLYHPSDIEMYPVSKTGKLESPQPPSKGWKNPMAMRTLHELRHLLNYFLKIEKIDKNTKVVVEMARELNDANKRWAIQTYQRYREEENKEFAKAIVGVAKAKYPNLNENDIENINKVRLWWEQVNNNEEVYKQIKALKEDVEKYRLWKEQECVCMYTGKMINITNLFAGTRTQLMHTFPASISFDNSLANLTVGDADYNNYIQGNKIPTQLPNYSQDVTINGKKYQAIEPNLKKWREKVEHLKNLIDENKRRTKKTQDPETKKGLIQRRHLLQFDYDYWNKKLETFTLTEIPAKWKNSQLVDTQIISKYARAYLKAVFEKVDVQKGSITDIFKKIYQIKGNEQKDRSKHSHHAVDAAILTLIPSSTRRETILEEYYKAEENHDPNYKKPKPYEKFKISHLLDIENNVIVNHVSHDKTLERTFKKLRTTRGNVIYQKDEKGNYVYYTEGEKKGQKVPVFKIGDTIRGQLHEETYLGAIKPNVVNEKGFAIKDDETKKYLVQQNNDEDVIWTVQRKKIEEVDLDSIIDVALKNHIKQQLDSGVKINDVKDFNDKTIRHIRFKKFSPSYDKSLKIKTHLFQSKYEHKTLYLANNASNYLCLLYVGKDKKEKEIKAYRFINLFEFSQIDDKQNTLIFNNPEYNIFTKFSGKNEYKLLLTNILKAGQKIILFKDSDEEIDKSDISNNQNRIYKIYKFNNSGADYLFLENIIEARSDDELKKAGINPAGETEFNPEKYQPRLKLTADKLSCLFEGKDFEIKPDGTITWIK
ncbi:MAG: hypothetical protein LBH22_06650 [Bacteroidales bacterium]|jgi:CRISPR-associated endonuclease Csn1|nr:hypothetical protein [Bacteroidales bacterium]